MFSQDHVSRLFDRRSIGSIKNNPGSGLQSVFGGGIVFQNQYEFGKAWNRLRLRVLCRFRRKLLGKSRSGPISDPAMDAIVTDVGPNLQAQTRQRKQCWINRDVELRLRSDDPPAY